MQACFLIQRYINALIFFSCACLSLYGSSIYLGKQRQTGHDTEIDVKKRFLQKFNNLNVNDPLKYE